MADKASGEDDLCLSKLQTRPTETQPLESPNQKENPNHLKTAQSHATRGERGNGSAECEKQHKTHAMTCG
ncbi:hypothetical protein Baya_3918 [Bagarius yarrelli]|uniref:Uncharacterized protein n=1 Tax=Bagarius yarrelli TaxID=175774 RepID=A0A556TWY2_BAGYA|nr:hypothetical protein Baya_3918 [Bagarius yarrelli]